MALNKAFDALGPAGLPMESATSSVKKSERRDETIHGFEPDVVGIHMIGLLPAKRLHRGLRRGAHAGRFGADDSVFAVRFVPDRDNFDALLGSQHARLKLRLP